MLQFVLDELTLSQQSQGLWIFEPLAPSRLDLRGRGREHQLHQDQKIIVKDILIQLRDIQAIRKMQTNLQLLENQSKQIQMTKTLQRKIWDYILICQILQSLHKKKKKNINRDLVIQKKLH